MSKEKALDRKAIHNIIYPDGGLGRKPVSDYVLDRVKELSFHKKENRDYIRGLSRLEEFILEGPHSWAGGMLYSSLRGNYPEEYAAIYKELKPDEFKEIKEDEERRRKKQEEEHKKREEERIRGLKSYESWWLTVGGKK